MFRFRLRTLFIVVGLIAVIMAYSSHRYRVAREALTSLTVNGRGYADGREVHIRIAGNALGRPAVVLIQHVATPSQTQSTAKLQSELQLEIHYPPDRAVSGLWIDGRKQVTGQELQVIYVSDVSAAEELEIPSASRGDFLSDAAALDPMKFVKKWVEPHRGG